MKNSNNTLVEVTQPKTLVEDLLTENRFWTFWSLDWTKKVYVRWNGQTKFSKIIYDMKKRMKVKELGYERQVQIKTPEVTYA